MGEKPLPWSRKRGEGKEVPRTSGKLKKKKNCHDALFSEKGGGGRTLKKRKMYGERRMKLQARAGKRN